MASASGRSRRGTRRAGGKGRRGASSRRSAALFRRRGDKRRRASAIPLLLILALLVLGWVGTPAHRRPSLEGLERLIPVRWVQAMERPAPPPPVELWIEPAELGQASPADWGWPDSTDERWALELGDVLSTTPAFRPADVAALELLRTRLTELSFVHSLPTFEASEEEGLVLELRLRRPVACLPVGHGFLTVDAEGVILSGFWPTPVRFEGAPLPVIGPMSDAGELFAYARPGDWLEEPEHLDALDVALSLAEHLELETRRSLGRLVIDATRARRVSVQEPGVRLLLEERRLVLFGRGPHCGEPGELAVARKWDSVRRALAPLDDPTDPFDWDVVDVRWDQPSFVPRPPALALLDGEAGAGPY